MNGMYDVSIGITTNMSVSATGWIAQNADSLGARSIWIGEDIALGQETFVLTANTLMQTKNVRIGTGIIPVTVHNIATLARAGLTLAEIGDGRFVFGLGIGGIQDLERHGIRIRKPVTELRKSVQTLNRLWVGETVDSKSELFSISKFGLGITRPLKIPIFFGVRGPQMLTLAGKIADGVILSGPFDYLRNAIKLVDDSAEEVGKERESVEKVVWVPTIPTFKGIKEKVAKWVVALVIADTPDAVIDMLNVDIERVQEIRESVAASSPKEGAKFVDDELLNVFSISGTKEHMVDRFEELEKIGATEVVLGPPFSGDWRGATTEIFEEVKQRSDRT
jgi:alkanesulfonate monooxygenase SsuD/methylene tetrahydromethanopterin reductase-like flavin-dependent oxidoreductase (luciferase family)